MSEFQLSQHLDHRCGMMNFVTILKTLTEYCPYSEVGVLACDVDFLNSCAHAMTDNGLNVKYAWALTIIID